MRRRYLTPPALPEETQCRGLVIPASKEWLAVFSQALLDTTYPYFYEQVNPTDLTPEAAAAKAYEIYEAWLTATCTGGNGNGGCVLPETDSPPYRHSVTTGGYEYLENGEWVEAELPPLPERTETTEIERLCAAATNAVYVLKLTWDAGKAAWDNEISETDAYVDTSLAIAGAIGAFFYPPLLSILALTQSGWEIVYHTYELLSTVSWDSNFNRKLICIFRSNATEFEGKVHFDLAGINADLIGAGLTGQAYLLMVGQVLYFLSQLGEAAIDMAGSLTNVAGDCATCGTWCISVPPATLLTLSSGHFDSNGWLIGSAVAAWGGRYGSAGLTVDTTGSVIRRVGLVLHANYPGTVTFNADVSPSVGLTNYTSREYNGGIGTLVMTPNDAARYSTGEQTTISFYIDRGGDQNPGASILRIEGTGRNPFPGSAVCG